MKSKSYVLVALLVVLEILLIIQIKAADIKPTDSLWREDFNYSSVSEMQAAGWSLTRPIGTSLSGGAVVLSGTEEDSAMSIRNIFSSDVYNWKAEDRNMWLGNNHSTQSITVVTEKHRYIWFVDGYYNQFAFYRDDAEISRFGAYQEAANSWMTLGLEKNGTTIKMYFNGELQKTYTDPDTTPSKVIGVDLVSPWRADAKYDYVWVEAAKTDDLEITKITPIQVEKEPQVLIVGKKAALAVDIVSTYQSSVRAMIKVTYDFGNKVYTEAGPEGVGVRIYPGENRVYLPGGPNFPTDPEPWQNPGEGTYLYWSKSGNDDNIKVELDPTNELKESDRTNNVMSLSEKVVDTAGLKILVVPVYFPDVPPEGPAGFQTLQTANIFDQNRLKTELAAQLRFLTEIYPISENKILLNLAPTRALHTKPGTTMNNLYDYSWLRRYVALPLTKEAKLAGYNRVAILINEIAFRDWAGVAIGMLREPENRAPVLILSDYLQTHDYLDAFLLAHEFGHTYYLWHPEYGLQGTSSPSKCDSYDVYSRKYEKTAYTVMSTTQDRAGPFWIDDARYESYPETIVTLKYENKIVQTKDSNLLKQFRSSPDPEVVLVSGIIFNNSTAETNDPWIRQGGIPDIQSGSVGDYSITTLDNSGRVIGRFGFNASFTGFEELNETFVGSTSDSIPFFFSIPYESGVTKIELIDPNGVVMASKVVTQNAPKVNSVSPSGGETFSSGSMITVKWGASDADGDSLLYSVLYSDDRGESWIPLSSNQAEETYTWNTTDIDVSEGYLIKVLATDGVNLGEGESSTTFKVGNQPSSSTTPTPANNLPISIYIIIGVAVMVLIVAAIVLVSRKHK